jgi:hypothetical protein
MSALVALAPALQFWTVPIVLLAAYQDGTTPAMPQPLGEAPLVFVSNDMALDTFRGSVLLALGLSPSSEATIARMWVGSPSKGTVVSVNHTQFFASLFFMLAAALDGVLLIHLHRPIPTKPAKLGVPTTAGSRMSGSHPYVRHKLEIVQRAFSVRASTKLEWKRCVAALHPPCPVAPATIDWWWRCKYQSAEDVIMARPGRQAYFTDKELCDLHEAILQAQWNGETLLTKDVEDTLLNFMRENPIRFPKVLPSSAGGGGATSERCSRGFW